MKLETKKPRWIAIWFDMGFLNVLEGNRFSRSNRIN